MNDILVNAMQKWIEDFGFVSDETEHEEMLARAELIFRDILADLGEVDTDEELDELIPDV